MEYDPEPPFGPIDREGADDDLGRLVRAGQPLTDGPERRA
jgi:hypothetical protein